ncbi:conjugal transfer protein TraG N-terminal domain-containing protein (plasmid) [Pseudomonas aeruginosa]|uniref:conjugal transfer protein TraG N-terminal domain-containing protein n=1 Tax=Pseudomonas aeruginosa TaxID=287 RepID=UPI0020013BD5|nr:conjugal transfer protein TraG N-terminal domain-containing protein [Pseudomonas aeruginosa]UPL41614.1 conjugal transfer protein TraG N-terminal domain-containing protein [Pseudomonas aeruginosa]
MDFTVFVLGDVSTFYNTLNSVAMIFNAKGFMTGVYLVGGFIALISGIMFVIQKGASEQFIPANGPVGGLFGFAMMVACCTIKADVKIEDIYTGTVNKVDNVPLVIAAPASLFTTTMYGLFEKINTAYQSTSGSYMAVTQNGFVTPLKLLLTLRKGVENVDPYLVASLKQYIIDCVPGSTTFSIADFQKSTNIVSYVLGHSRGTGLTTYWDNVNIGGSALSCQEAQTKIALKVDAFPSSAAAKQMINAGMKVKSPSGSAYTPDDVSAAITNLVPSLWSAAQSADDFMVNALFYNSVVGTYNCLDSVSDQNSFNLCMTSLTQQDEQFRSDAAASGSFFAKIMTPTMVFLQILFFGFAPIVIIYSLFKGAGSLMMYVKFLGFGIWTTSWLPFSAVIQMYIQNDVAEKLTEFTEAGLVPSNMKAVYYDVLATRLGIASDMLAATPLISAAMLGLTAYGMVSLASRWSGRDHNDEKLQSPDLVKNGAHVDVASRNQYQSEHSGSVNNGLSLNGANWNTADLKNTLSTSTQSAFGSDHSKRSESSSAVEASLRQMSSYKSGDSWTDQRMQSLDRQHSNISQQAMKLGDSIGQALGFTGKEMNSFKEAFDAEVGFSGIFGGVSAGIQNATGKDMTKSQASTIASQFGSEISKNESDMSGWKASVADTFSHSTGREAATENALGRRLSATTADTQSSFNRFQQATSAEAGVSANAKISEETTGGNLTRSQQGMQALNQAIAGLSDSQRSEFNKKFPELETRYAQQSTGMVGARESAQLWALKSIGADTEFANVISAMTGNVVGGPSEGDAAKFQGVGGRAAQVSDNPAGQVSRANIGNPSTNVPGVNPNQVGPTGAPQPQELREVASGMDPYRSYEDRETYVSSQMPSSHAKAQEQMRAGKTALENADTTLSPEQIRDTMSVKPITNTMVGVGQAEQQWEQENPKTAMAVTAATMFVPGAGWGGAAIKGTQATRAVLAARSAETALKAAEAGTEVAQAARVVNAAGHEVPALLRGQGQASRVVNAEHVAEAAETAKAAAATAKTAGREAAAATKLAGNVSVVPGMMIASDHMADNYNADVAANGKPERFEPGSSVRSMLQSDGATPGPQAQSGQPLVTPMPARADALAPLGGHAGNLMAAPGENTQAAAHGQPLVTPINANAEAPAPAPAPIRQEAPHAQSSQPVAAAALAGGEGNAPIRQDAAPVQASQPVAAAALTSAEAQAPIRQDAAPVQASQPVAAAALTGVEAAPITGHAGELRAAPGEGLMTAGTSQNLMEPIGHASTAAHTGQLHMGSQPAMAESHTELQAGEMMTASGAGLMTAGAQSQASAGLSAGEPQLSGSDNGSGSPYGEGMMGAADAYESPFSGGGKPAPVTRVMTLENTVVTPEDKGDDDAKPPTTRGGKS